MDEKKLQQLRQQIDALDDQILELLNRRAEVVVEVGKSKQKNRGEYYVPSREKAIYERLIARNPGPFSDEGCAASSEKSFLLPCLLNNRSRSLSSGLRRLIPTLPPCSNSGSQRNLCH